MSSASFHWICPYCHRETTIVASTNQSVNIHFYDSSSKEGLIGLQTEFIVCPNPECSEYIIKAFLYSAKNLGYNDYRIIKDKGPIFQWMLKPPSSAIPQPEYIPLAIRQDYMEACAIINLSPKAAATLARRCLQGMIRDFWGISKSRLVDEINELQSKVDSSIWDAIDAVRQIGNIGAHMEKDVNLVIDIEPEEAILLVNLIEDLFQLWYVTRHDREERSKKIQSLAQSKKGSRIQAKTT